MSNVKPFKLSQLSGDMQMKESDLTSEDLFLVSDIKDNRGNEINQSKSLRFDTLQNKIVKSMAPEVVEGLKDDVTEKVTDNVKPTIQIEVNNSVKNELTNNIQSYATIQQYVEIVETEQNPHLLIDCGDGEV